jgi:phage shock protein A
MVGILTRLKAKINKWERENVSVDEVLELDKKEYQEKISKAKEKVIKLTTERNKLETTHREFEGRIHKAEKTAKVAAGNGDAEAARKALAKKKKYEGQRANLEATIQSLKDKEDILKSKVEDMEEAMEMLDADNISLKAQLSAAEVSKDAAEMLTGMGDDDSDFNDIREIADDRTKEFSARAKALTDLADEGFVKAREFATVEIDDDELDAELEELMKSAKKE